MGYYEEYEKISKVEEQFLNQNPSARENCQRYTVEDALEKWGVDVKEQIRKGEEK